MRIVVIGGVAAGMSAASQAKRRRPDAEVIVLERGPHVSYGSCGMPYNIEDPSREIADLVVITAEAFRRDRGIDVRLQHEALSIDVEGKRVRARDLVTGEEYDLSYDRLVIATGARAARPPIPGIDLPGIFLLRELTDGEAIKKAIAERRPRRVAIVGGGYIGLEMSEAFRHLGLEVAILERLDQVAPGYDPEIAGQIEAELRRNGVDVRTGVTVRAFEPTDRGLRIQTDQTSLEVEMALVAVGVRPNAELAEAAGIRLGASGAIAVDDRMRTSAPDVWAAGDCAEAQNVVTGRPVWVPLGTTANKQGKVAGANAADADERFRGIAGTAAFKVFDLHVGRTGLSLHEAEAAGISAIRSLSRHRTRGHNYPGSKPITTVLTLEKETGRLLGAQVVAPEGVAGRVNVYATALYAGMDVDDLAALDLAYAPPLAPVWDPILIAARVAQKDLGRD